MSLSVAIIGNTNHRLMEFALEKTIKAVPYDDVLVFCDEKINLSVPYKYYKLPKIFNLGDYSTFCIKELNKYVKTDYCMTIQYDGFAVNSLKWTDDFLKYDCIGPLISPSHPPMYSSLSNINTEKSKEIIKKNEWRSGGGGFNIKSKKFLELCSNDSRITGFIEMNKVMGPYDRKNGIYETFKERWICDDLELAYYYDEIYKENNINFAPVDLTLSFAAEITTGYNFSLGFHGWYNTALFLEEDEVIYYIKNLDRKQIIREAGFFIGFLLANNYQKALALFDNTKWFSTKNTNIRG
jgi:hypothetical protein